MVRHPHTLTVTWKQDGTYNADGDYVVGADNTSVFIGRAEANGSGSLVTLEDGSTIVYNWSFLCGPNVEVPFGADAVLTNTTTGAQIWSGTIKRHAPAQIHSQIWL